MILFSVLTSTPKHIIYLANETLFIYFRKKNTYDEDPWTSLFQVVSLEAISSSSLLTRVQVTWSPIFQAPLFITSWPSPNKRIIYFLLNINGWLISWSFSVLRTIHYNFEWNEEKISPPKLFKLFVENRWSMLGLAVESFFNKKSPIFGLKKPDL